MANRTTKTNVDAILIVLPSNFLFSSFQPAHECLEGDSRHLSRLGGRGAYQIQMLIQVLQ
jgi:hypothetical protein